MLRLLSLLTLAAGLLLLGGCASVETSGGYARPHIPTVSMPRSLGSHERRLLPRVEDALIEAGYRPARRPDTDYHLDFSVEAGPINADVAISLRRGSQEVVRGYARSGGARTMFRRQETIDRAFEKALAEFQSRLPVVGGAGAWPRSEGLRQEEDRVSPAPNFYDMEDAERGR